MKMPSSTHNLPSGTGREVLQARSSMPSVRFENEYPHRFTAYSLVPPEGGAISGGGGAQLGEGEGPWKVISSPWFLTLSPLPGPSSHEQLPPQAELLCHAFPDIEGLISLKPASFVYFCVSLTSIQKLYHVPEILILDMALWKVVETRRGEA